MFSYKKIGERTHYSGFSDDSLFSGEGTYNTVNREDVDLVTLINDDQFWFFRQIRIIRY